MRQPPTYTPWKITCHSSADVQALQQWLAARIDLDRVMLDTICIAPDGVEQLQAVRHRLGDYFADIRILMDSQADPTSIRLIFHRRAEAGRFWKDLMVDVLQEIETTPQKPSVALDLKGQTDPPTCTTGLFQ